MRVTWSDDGAAAYLIDEYGTIVGRWFRDRPELSTFDPRDYTYGQGYGYQAPGQQQSHMFDVWRGGGDGGFLQDPEKLKWDEDIRRWELDYAETVKGREQLQQQHDDWIVQDEKRLAQQIEIKRMEIAASTGEIRLQHELELVEMERQHQYDVQYLQLDYAERHKILDKEIAFAREELWSRERLAAAQMSAEPQYWRRYEHWAAGLGGEAHPSGLPPGAPMFQTGPGMEGATVPGTAPTVSPYGAALASGQRMPEFQAWGGPTTPVGDIPWTPPHKVNLSQFLESPDQFQERMYGAWRERGLTRQTAQQRIYAAAPVGTAPAQVRYG